MYTRRHLIGYLTSATKMRDSLSGSPRWKLSVDHQAYVTASHIGVLSYTDFTELVGAKVAISLDDANKIVSLSIRSGPTSGVEIGVY